MTRDEHDLRLRSLCAERLRPVPPPIPPTINGNIQRLIAALYRLYTTPPDRRRDA